MKKDSITAHKGFIPSFHNRGKQYPGKAGFTLIELLIAVSIFSVVATVLYSCFRGGITSWRRINSEYALQQKVRYALNVMNKDLRNMVYLSNLAFGGSSDRIKLNTFIRSGDEIFLGRVGYYLVADKNGEKKLLVRSENSLEQALSSSIEEEEPGPEEGEELLGDISELTFSYLSIVEKIGETGEREYEWVESWETEEAIPLGIKIEFAINLPEDNRTLAISKRIYIPTGKSAGAEESMPE